MYPVGARVRVAEPVDYGAGTQHWVGRIGTVKTARRRSCDVLLDDDPEKDLLWFFHRELALLEDG